MSAAPRPGRSGLALGLVLTGLLAGAAVLSLVWTPYDPAAQDIGRRMLPPSAAHLLGTDHFGRDVLSMIMAGARASLGIALAATAIGLGVGAPLGLLAASRRDGVVDEAVMRVNDIVFAFPALVLAILLAAVFGPGAAGAIVAIGLFNVPVFARLTRAGALGQWSRDYVSAARAAGRSDLAISIEHIAPNLAGLLIVQAAIQAALGVGAEAGLSYVGLGVQPPSPSWGRMLNDAQTLAGTAPWLAVFPGLAIALSVLGLSLLGEGLRDRLDPAWERRP